MFEELPAFEGFSQAEKDEVVEEPSKVRLRHLAGCPLERSLDLVAGIVAHQREGLACDGFGIPKFGGAISAKKRSLLDGKKSLFEGRILTTDAGIKIRQPADFGEKFDFKNM